LVGSAAAEQSDEPPGDIGIVQTQLPDIDGVPLAASHLSGLDYEAHQQKQQYFVRAFYELVTLIHLSIPFLQRFTMDLSWTLITGQLPSR
jgi:hypothetical protein